MDDDHRYMAAALALSARHSARTGRSPSVGCIIVKDGRIIGRGITQPGGRPHAEAVAIDMAGAAAAGADFYVTLEPCAHDSGRGPDCCGLIITARPARVIMACDDPDPRTAGKGAERLKQAGITLKSGVMAGAAPRMMADFFTVQTRSRPLVTLKLATSLDGKIALANGASRWISGEAARRHCHLERARHQAILVGAGTVRADDPSLDVRLSGLEGRSPARIMLGHGPAPAGWRSVGSPQEIASLPINSLMIEGGATTASAFLKAGLVDRILLYRAPIWIGQGQSAINDIGLAQLADAHGQWTLADSRMLGKDRMEIYERADQDKGSIICSPASSQI